MAQLDYQRWDLPVDIQIEKDTTVRINIGGPSPVRQERFDLNALLSGSDLKLSQPMPFKMPAEAFRQSGPATAPALYRLAVSARDPELAGMDWERLLIGPFGGVGYPQPAFAGSPSWTVVRSTLVRPRSSNFPLSLPLRILQLNPRREHKIPEWIRQLFGKRPKKEVDQAVLVQATESWMAPPTWPTVDVLHVDFLPGLLFGGVMLTSAWSVLTGSLGWFVRWTDRWQTRLVVIHCTSNDEAAVARQLAQALCDKAGPAVMVTCSRNPSDLISTVPLSRGDPSSAEPNARMHFYHYFYDQLVHDQPLDQIVSQVRPGFPAQLATSLFVGAGREEAVRVSNVGVALVDVSSKLSAPGEEANAITREILTGIKRAPKKPGRIKVGDRASEVRVPLPVGGAEVSLPQDFTVELSRIETDWKDYKFNLHESDGLVPLSGGLQSLRHSLGVPATRTKTSKRSDIWNKKFGAPKVTRARKLKAIPAEEPRFVNSSFWSEKDGAFKKIEQDAAVLTPGELYHLEVNIGPKDPDILTINIAAIFEEVFKWADNREGVWVEIGVAGIDFELAGDPAQELWLPRNGASEPVYFPVVPKKEGVAQLRFGLYYKNNLIQSFRMAAITRGASKEPINRSKALSDALSVAADRIGNKGYIARLEYSRTTKLDEIENKPSRALCITANQLEGQDILTIKGPDICRTKIFPDDEMPNIVTQIRTALNDISYAKVAGVAEPQYRFGPYETDKDNIFSDSLSKLASAGFRLYNSLAPAREHKQALETALQGEQKTIQIAPILRKKVIPWAFVYDREYDENTRMWNNTPVQQGVCTAALPAKGTALQTTTCGEHPECLLNTQRQAEQLQKGGPQYCERTVACPLRFWGFRHVIEAPPQQLEADENEKEEKTCIVPSGKLQSVAGLNANLGTCATHWADITKILPGANPGYERDHILQSLRKDTVDFVYFFCHARGGQGDDDKTDPPYLEFESDPKARILPQHLSDSIEWTHAPLIFLNACGTLGYSPDALSPFIKVLVQGRKAAGVLGTEVPVAEFLAGEVAREFISRFVTGTQAGCALLEVRRELLARKNPLGLVYTLLAPAELAVDHDGDGKCPH